MTEIQAEYKGRPIIPPKFAAMALGFTLSLIIVIAWIYTLWFAYDMRFSTEGAFAVYISFGILLGYLIYNGWKREMQ